ncbi:MAG: efflux RND transporter periplasmic adaptor subunit [Prolixibacteraceae bacterium]|nr:efflux RND transporter periplasmic adaptor subunit [Prolixibacteraceae bacterium]
MDKKFSVILAILVALMVSSCAPKQNEQDAITRKVKVATPQKDSAVLTRNFSGIIQETAETNLSFRVAGPIEKIHVKEGGYVRKGQLVAQIDPRDYQIQVDAAKAQYEQVKSEFERLTELKKRESVSSNDYEKAVAGEKMLRSKLEHAKDQLNDTKLYAPYSGYIQSVKFNEGELIDAGMPVAKLLDTGSYAIEVDLPMSFFVHRESFTSFTCQQPVVSDSVFQLQLIGHKAKAGNNQLFTTKFRLPNHGDTGFLPGMNAEVVISYQSDCECPVHVPLTSVFNKDGKAYVWIFNKENSTVHKKEVQPDGLANDGRVRISSGIGTNEFIVVSGVNALHEGEKVELLKPASETNIGGLL